MKFFKLASVMLLLCGAAFAQVTLTCPHCALGPLSYTTALNTDSISKGIILNNTSASPVPLTWSITGADFLPGWTSCKTGSIAPGKCTISVKYHPTLAAFPPINASGTLTINAGTPTVTTVVNLTGNTTGTAAKFVVGDRVIVNTSATSVNVRATPSSTGTLLGVQPSGALGSVLAGPIFDGVDNRWNINFDTGPDGWSIERLLDKSSIPPPPPGKSVRLKWDPPASDGAASYNLYRASGSGGLVKVGNVVGSLLTFTDTAVPSGTYQYAATTVDSTGKESVDSNVVTVTVTIP